jgi:hypothetical protein
MKVLESTFMPKESFKGKENVRGYSEKIPEMLTDRLFGPFEIYAGNLVGHLYSVIIPT